MKDIASLLQRHRPVPARPLDSTFTDTVIAAIEQRSQPAHVIHVLRIMYQRLRMLPTAAFVVLIIFATITGTTVTYAAINWLIPTIKVLVVQPNNDDNKREFAIDVQDCGVMVGGQTADNGQQRFEVAKDAHLNDDQVIKVIRDSCKYQQLLHIGQTRWKDNSNFGAGASNVTNDPPIGKVVALDESNITITSTVYQSFDGPSFSLPGQPIPDFNTLFTHFPEGKELTRTFALHTQVDVLNQGSVVPRSNLTIGDTVFFMSAAKPRDKPEDAGDKYGLPATVVHLIKTDIDPAYVQPMSLGNPAIINAIARIFECQGNSSYLCLTGNKQGMSSVTIYAAGSQEFIDADAETFANNAKYLRSDIDRNNPDAGKYFHHIEGRITKISSNSLEIRSRGKTELFTVAFPYEATTIFNQRHEQKIQLGDYLKIDYFQKEHEDVRTIKSGDLIAVSLLQRQVGDGTFIKY